MSNFKQFCTTCICCGETTSKKYARANDEADPIGYYNEVMGYDDGGY